MILISHCFYYAISLLLRSSLLVLASVSASDTWDPCSSDLSLTPSVVGDAEIPEPTAEPDGESDDSWSETASAPTTAK